MSKPLRKSILLSARGLDPVGSGRQLELVATGLVAAGWQVHLASTTRGGSVPDRLAAAGVTVHRLGGRRDVDLGAVARLARLAARLKPAVILAWGRGQLLPASAARWMSTRTRLAAHLDHAVRGTEAAIAARFDLVLTTGAATAASIRTRSLSTWVVDVPFGVHPAAPSGLSRAAIATRLGLKPDSIWTLCVAPLEPRSRLERLLWAIDQLGVVRKDLEHVLVGDGPLLQRLRRRSRVQELSERLVILPHCDLLPDLLHEVRLVWQAGDVACGGAILDGMAVGVPAVSVVSDAARWLIVDGETGRIVPALPESELPRRAFGVLEDPALAAAYAAAARSRAATVFPAAAMVAAHVEAVESLVGGR